MQENKLSETSGEDQHSPPLFKSWGGWYAAVILVLILLILLFYLFTKHYA